MKWLVAFCLALLACQVDARMYQWVSPQSHATQLSGKPPPWYRGPHGGPRVIVFENGQVIDDTAIEVSQEHRESLRGVAFGLLAEELVEKQEKRAELATKLKEMAESDYLDELLQEEEPPAPIGVPEPPRELEILSTVEQLKAVIDAWDRFRTQRAKRIVADEPEGQGAEDNDQTVREE